MPARAPRSRNIDRESATDGELLPPRITVDNEFDPDLEAAFEQLKEDFRQAQSDGTVWVYRLPLDANGELVSNAKHVYLFSAPVQRYSTEEIYAKVQREYMRAPDGSPMRVTCIRVAATKKGERGVRFNQVVMVEAPTPDPAQAGSGPGAAGAGGFADVVRAIHESNQATVAMMRELLKPTPQLPAPAGQQPIAQIRELAEVVYLLQGGKQPAGATPPVATPPPSILDQLKTLRELRSFVGELGGAGGDTGDDGGTDSGEGPVQVLRHLSPWASVFAQMLQRGGTGQPVRRVQRPPQTIDGSQPTPAAAPTAPPPAPAATVTDPFSVPTPPPQSTQVDPMIAQFREQLQALTNAAAEGAKAPDLIPVIMAAIPTGSQMEDMFLAMLESDTWWGQITAIYPPATAQGPWFAELRTAILAEYENPTE